MTRIARNIAHNARLSVAPMMDWTDRHCRTLHRVMSKHALLYTEMVTAPAIVRGGAVHLLDYGQHEHPVALQLGGSDPAELAQATQIACDLGYDEINLNVGCPSDRVQSGFFGAVLMEKPDLVAECVAAMIDASSVDVTIKCRIGVDDHDPTVVLPDFITRVSDAGVTRFQIHARKAWLQGLSPKENRDVPPLDYDLVVQMKEQFSDFHISINGGIADLGTAQQLLDCGLDGVMIGRAAYHNPSDILLPADQMFFGETGQKTPDQVVHEMLPYIEAHIEDGGRLNQITRHMLGLFAARPGARLWRRYLSENAHKDGAGVHVVLAALDQVMDAAA